MGQRTHYFKVGAFVLTGVSILVATVIVVAGSVIFETMIPAETYFNESVQGLDIGSPVKYRGVAIGRVSSIGFIPPKYTKQSPAARSTRYVMVGMQLKEAVLQDYIVDEDIEKMVGEMVEHGLRVRLTTQGLTGVAFLEMNFFDPEQNKELPLPWDPDTLYVPSAPSTMSRIEGALDAVGGVMRDLEEIDFKSFAQSIDNLLQSMDEALRTANVKDIGQLAVETLREMRDTMERVHVLVDDPAVDTILPDVSAAATSARHIFEGSEKDVLTAMKNIRTTSESLQKASVNIDKLLASPELSQAAEGLPEILDNVNKASRDIRRSTVQLERVLRRLSTLVSNQSANVESILEDTKSAVKDFNELVDDVKQNPSRLFLSEPPNRINMEPKE